MNNSILARDARFMGISAAMLVATLTALLAVFVLAKPSGAQQTDIVTVKPSEVGFGAVQVGTDREDLLVREIYVRNTGDSRVRVGIAALGGTQRGTQF
jgi:hypothetical protein